MQNALLTANENKFFGPFRVIYESKDSESSKSLCDFKNYLERLNLDQLRTMSKEFIL